MSIQTKQPLTLKYRPQRFSDVYEQDAVKQILQYELQTGNIKRCLLFTGPAGCGKTTSARIFAKEIESTVSNIIEINCADHTGIDDARQLIIEPSKSKPLVGAYKIFILDECFSGNTLVSTIHGSKQIKDIIPGDIVQHMNGYGKVAHVFHNKVKTENLFFIKINGKDLITTQDHLFFTNEGWVKAKDLKPGDVLYDRETMSKLSKNVSNIQQQILQPELFTGVSAETKRTEKECSSNKNMCNLSQRVSSTSQVYSSNLQQEMYAPVNIQYRVTHNEFRITDGYTETILRKNEEKQSQFQSRSCKESKRDQKEEEYSSSVERRKRWKRSIYNSSDSFMGAFRRWVYTGICNSNAMSSSFASISYELQSRPCLSREKVSDRGGWQIPSLEKDTVKRCQESGMLGKFRVESCEIFQRGNNEQLFRNHFSDKELNSDYVIMYDLQIQGHPSYYVNDVLVHNCHMLTAQSQNALLKLLEEPPSFCVYIMCTTDPQKVLSTILSRCFRYDFQLISHQGIVNRLNYILTQEQQDPNGCGVQSWNMDALNFIALHSKGHMRNSIVTLEKSLAFDKHLTIQNVEKVLGVTGFEDMFKVLDSILNKQQDILLQSLDNIEKSGIDLKLFIKNFLQFVLDINKYIILKTECPNTLVQFTMIPPSYENRLQQYNVAHRQALKQLLQLLLQLNSLVRWETNVKPVLETNLLLEIL